MLIYYLLKPLEQLAQLFSFLPSSLSNILPMVGMLQVDQGTWIRTVNLAHGLLLPLSFQKTLTNLNMDQVDFSGDS